MDALNLYNLVAAAAAGYWLFSAGKCVDTNNPVKEVPLTQQLAVIIQGKSTLSAITIDGGMEGTTESCRSK